MIRLGIIGVGGYGQVHLKAFRELQAEGKVAITAMADSNPEVLRQAVSLPDMAGVKTTTDYQSLLENDLEALSIAAPIPFHEEMTRAALDHGLYVLLEKPPVPLLSQLDGLLAHRHHDRVMVAFQHPHFDHLRQLKADLVEQRWGKLLSISTWGLWPRHTGYYQRAGWAGRKQWGGYPVLDGPATNAMAHYLNALFFLSGPTMEASAGFRHLEGEVYRARRALESYDTACLRGTLESGADFFYGVTHAVRTTRAVKMEIRTTHNVICLNDDLRSLSTQPGEMRCHPDQRHEMFRRFLCFAGGDHTVNFTPLAACRPYVAAANAMLASSGGIHDIAPEWIDAPDPEAPEGIYHIRGIEDYLSDAFTHRRLLAACGVPWAIRSGQPHSGNLAAIR